MMNRRNSIFFKQMHQFVCGGIVQKILFFVVVYCIAGYNFSSAWLYSMTNTSSAPSLTNPESCWLRDEQVAFKDPWSEAIRYLWIICLFAYL